MIRNKTLVVLAGALLLLSASAVQAREISLVDQQTKDKEKRVTIAIECGSQGIVDADWTMEFDIFGPDGKKINSSPITVSVPTGTGSGAAAQRMALGINMVAGSGTASSGETAHKKYGGTTGNLKAEDVTLKDGYEVKNVTTKKEGKEDCDHLKVIQWERCVDKGKSFASQKAVVPGGVGSVTIGVVPITPSPLFNGPITEARIRLVDVNTAVVGLEFSILGTDSSGNPFTATVDAPLDGTLPLSTLVGYVGLWAEAVGFTATYPANDTVKVDFKGSGITIDEWSFTAYVVDDANTLQGSSVTYTAN